MLLGNQAMLAQLMLVMFVENGVLGHSLLFFSF